MAYVDGFSAVAIRLGQHKDGGTATDRAPNHSHVLGRPRERDPNSLEGQRRDHDQVTAARWVEADAKALRVCPMAWNKAGERSERREGSRGWWEVIGVNNAGMGPVNVKGMTGGGKIQF